MEFLRVFCAFLLLGLAVSEENTGCPTLSVSPCTCTADPLPVLECNQVQSSEVLRQVFRNSAGTTYDEFWLTNSVLEFIPHEIFDEVEVTEIHLKNNKLSALFDETPRSLTNLDILNILSTTTDRPFDWEQLQPMKKLRILTIDSIQVPVLGGDFAQYAPKSLEEFSLIDTKTTKIEAGVFNNFPNLEKVTINKSPLKELNRNFFPVPFNGRHLSFEESELATVPDDMFSNMPRLRSLSLKGNRLTHLKRDILGPMSYINLENNYLICDCGFAWLMKNTFMTLKGTCHWPLSLNGRRLVDVYINTSCRI